MCEEGGGVYFSSFLFLAQIYVTKIFRKKHLDLNDIKSK